MTTAMQLRKKEDPEAIKAEMRKWLKYDCRHCQDTGVLESDWVCICAITPTITAKEVD